MSIFYSLSALIIKCITFFLPKREDSSGFEHVFVGETKFGREIMGLHNWVQFYLQEKQDLLDYKGYKARDNNAVLISSINTKITQQ